MLSSIWCNRVAHNDIRMSRHVFLSSACLSRQALICKSTFRLKLCGTPPFGVCNNDNLTMLTSAYGHLLTIIVLCAGMEKDKAAELAVFVFQVDLLRRIYVGFIEPCV